jgi:hypothetical protein
MALGLEDLDQLDADESRGSGDERGGLRSDCHVRSLE